jgi:hypothetical protein
MNPGIITLCGMIPLGGGEPQDIEANALLVVLLKSISSELDGLEPKEKLNVICKLMPFVFPKVQTVSLGEPLNTSFWQ